MLEKNESLAEMIGIILGDGRIRWDPTGRHYQLDIILNYVDEREYVLYVKDYLKSLFKIEPKINRQKNDDGTLGKGIYLTIYNKNLIEQLISLGLKSGNKVINQVRVPKWIREENIHDNQTKSLVIACLRGLIDTDGSIFPNLKENAIKINFKNGSLPLVKDLKELSESLGIRLSKITPYKEISKETGNISTTYIVSIQARDQVKKFLNIVNPMKWIFRMDKLLKILDKPFEYRMKYYSTEDVDLWISLYEKFKSFNAVRNYLLNSDMNTPRKETIRLRIKERLGYTYPEWLKKVKNNTLC